MMSLALSPLVIVNDIPEMHTMQKRQHATDLTDDPSPYPMLKRALNFSKATNSRRTEDQYKEVPAAPPLPCLRKDGGKGGRRKEGQGRGLVIGAMIACGPFPFVRPCAPPAVPRPP